MIAALQRQYHQLVTSGAQVVLAVLGAASESARGWTLALSAMALLSVLAWASALKRRRLIADTPTARIASAAQGPVEIRGTGHAIPDNPVRSPLTGLPCLWYRFQVERQDSDQKWRVEQRGESDTSFIVRDDSGEVLVDPDHAEILTRHKESWLRGDTRSTEWKFIDGDPIYVLGELRTLAGSTLTLDVNADVKALLGEWKSAPETLKARFDRDGDGHVDMDEWDAARIAAHNEVRARHRESRNLPATHLIRAPRGRPYLIANIDPQRLATRYGAWSLFHLCVFLASLAAIPFVWQHFAP